MIRNKFKLMVAPLVITVIGAAYADTITIDAVNGFDSKRVELKKIQVDNQILSEQIKKMQMESRLEEIELAKQKKMIKEIEKDDSSLDGSNKAVKDQTKQPKNQLVSVNGLQGDYKAEIKLDGKKYIVAKGDVIDDKYKVSSINISNIVLEDKSTHKKIKIDREGINYLRYKVNVTNI